MGEESVSQPVFAFTPKKTHYWKQAESGFERGRSSIVIRKSISFFNKLRQRQNLTVDCRCPCLTCTVKIAQVGISEVVYSQGYNMDNDVSQCLSVSSVPINLI